MLIASAYSKGWRHNGGRQEITIQILTRMYLYIFQLLKLRRCTLSLFTIVLAVLAPAQQSAGLAKPFFTGSHHVRRSARFLPCDTISWGFQVPDLTDEPKLLSHCQFPLGQNPPRSQGASVSRASTSTGLKTVSMDCLERFWLNRNIYRSNTLSLIDATLYLIKSSFKAAPQGITW